VLEAALLDHPLELRAVVVEHLAREPLFEILERARAILVCDVLRREAALAGGTPRRCRAHADLRTSAAAPPNSPASARPVRSGSWWISAPSGARSARTIRYGARLSGP